jgi:hypothetical protein
MIKTERVRRARAARAALSQYNTWQTSHMAEAFPAKDAVEQRWAWLLAARAELDQLIIAEREAGGAKWRAWAARRG